MNEEIKVGDKARLFGEWSHITEVWEDVVRIRPDGLSHNTYPILKRMLHKVPYKQNPIAKMSFYWKFEAGDE